MVFDNDYLRLFAALGIVGLVALGLAILRSLVSAPIPGRMMTVVLAVACTSYDVFTWRSLAFVFVAALSISAADAQVVPKLPDRSAYKESRVRSSKPA